MRPSGFASPVEESVMKRLKVIALAVCLLLAYGLAAYADVIILKDGTRYDGSVIYTDAHIVIVKTDSKLLKIDKEQVFWIAQGGGIVEPQKPNGLTVEQAADKLVGDCKAQLEKMGQKTVAVPPFWGPEDKNCALQDTLAAAVAKGLAAAGYRVIEPGAVDKVLAALQLQRSALHGTVLAARLANVLGAKAVVVGKIAASGDAVEVKAVVIEVDTAKTAGEVQAAIVKDANVQRLLGLEPVKPAVIPAIVQKPAVPVVVDDSRPKSAISSKFTGRFTMRAFYYKYISGKANAKFEGESITWVLESGNTATLDANGKVTIVSTRPLTDENQAKNLENDLAGIFVKLASMVDNYPVGQIHKSVEFDSVYYADRPNVFHRYIVRERDDVSRRNWLLQKNGNNVLYAKISLIIDGSWAKLSLGDSYVVSFGRWSTRNAAIGSEDSIPVKITPYGWVKWYVAVIDVVTEAGRGPARITGWGSQSILYRTNSLIDELIEPRPAVRPPYRTATQRYRQSEATYRERAPQPRYRYSRDRDPEDDYRDREPEERPVRRYDPKPNGRTMDWRDR